MKRPSFQFYPADWRNNAKLRRCSWAARGVWIELLGLLHDSDDYGLLRWPLRQIAQALGCPLKLLNELVECGVLYGTEKGTCEALVFTPRSGRKSGDPVVLVAEQAGPVWFSPRMVRDEYVRNVRGIGTRFSEGANPSPKGGIGEGLDTAPSQRQGDGSTSSSSSTITTTAPTGASVEARQRFEMHLEWQPDDVSLRAQFKALGVSPEQLTGDVLAEFRAFWVTKSVADSQGGWCHRLVKWLKGQTSRKAAAGAAVGDDWAAQGVTL
ncbi:DnaT-like ssDNA-binding domain-containing protein [Pseudomonas sp. TTU2014-080ASC]|uniref:DnaT-like ssDNA-binding domain-containing protein n=1 Tax=Pseudomonas sp. TTU2014-080ASC TaxID=1729724 RepID=UPI0007187479|nr:DnaT-like ssDNA-binding domain-containing protein [Pseudomonas sp. TTU2014-080ASC]KRW62355.1 hypothetical protein AO726_02730 [Pseudomonas sp. TTU2014-080ASC]